MPQYKIDGEITPAESTAITAASATIRANYPYSITGMNLDKKNHLHGVGPLRRSFIEAMHEAVKMYSTKLGNLIDQDAFAKNHELLLANETIKNGLSPLWDTILFIEKLAQNNDYDYSLLAYKALHTLGETDSAINKYMSDKSEVHFSRATQQLPNLTTIPPSSKTVVNQCDPGKRGTNTGDTLLTFNHAGASIVSEIKVLPGDSFIIPPTWVDIEVANKSSSTEGEFSIPTNNR